ncbi:SH3 domain-containing protein [Pseudomonas sp. GM55]|uniref:SH3 domain-containing protein n=1 Tax=Pseudomonas sp. GM55 TaxID=1144333 RepID=UPI000270702D|nr:SH3 domain-containing protein [Pseudomonas sp. GM55]EJM65036.1 putative outer membrane lipoprotein [Pseudomonas sp. GM55]
MRKKFLVSVLALAIAASTSGCAELGINKQQAGTAMGVVAGAVVGQFIGKGNGRIVATLIGSALGGYIGNKIGAKLDEQDQQALAQRTQDALNASPNGSTEPVSWASAHSGATAQIVQGQEFTQTKTVEVKRAPKIVAVPSMKLINEQYLTKSSSNVRAAPEKSADKVGGLKPGTEFTAVGSTGDWILVGRKGVTVGYVHKDLVEPKAVAVAKSVKPAANLDEMNVAADKETKAFDLDSIPTLPTQQVAAETSCRPVTVSLKAADGNTEQEKNTFCKQANGTWELI